MSLIPLPSPNSVSSILDAYFDEAKATRRIGSAEADILEEVVMGMKDYFEMSLGNLLLYRLERQQYFEVRNILDGKSKKDSVGPEWEGFKGKTVVDVYGAEHLARLFSKSSFSCLLSYLPPFRTFGSAMFR